MKYLTEYHMPKVFVKRSQLSRLTNIEKFSTIVNVLKTNKHLFFQIHRSINHPNDEPLRHRKNIPRWIIKLSKRFVSNSL